MTAAKRLSPTAKVTVLTSLFQGDDDIEHFLANLVATEGFDAVCAVEIDDVRISHRDAQHVEAIVAAYARSHAAIHYHVLDDDPGLYEIWNRQIRRSATPYLTLGCIDDRRNPSVFREHVAVLDADPSLDVVCGPTLATAIPNETWESNSSYRTYSCSFNWQTSPVSSLGSRSEFGLADLFRRGPTGEWIDSDCLPHCMPTWRRSLHERFGFFDETRYAQLADWEFWIRCASGGARFRLLPAYSGLYYVNPQSHNRRTDSEVMKRRIIDKYWAQQGELNRITT